ncbi:FRIGIDA-ESSENTIAL 1-like protein isoform X1, partial [Tanacetum coccineum]
LEDQNGNAVTSPIESITAPHLEEQPTLMITDDVNDAQQKEPRLDVLVIRPRSSSPAVEVNEGNKRPANICDSPATEVNEENKRQAVICSFFANGWCIKGNSCKFRHIKDHTSVSDQQKETSVAAYQRSEPQNDEGLANSAAAPSITCSSEVKPELQKENIVTIPSVNGAGTKGLQENPPANPDSSLHEASSNLINGSDTLKNSWVSSYAATMEEPGGKGNQFGFHNNKMPTTSYSINHNSSSFQSTMIIPPSNHSSVWPMASTFLSSSTLKHLGSQSEHLYSTNEVLLNPVTKLSTYEWAPSKPFRSTFLISQGIYTPDIQYDPIRDSIDSPKIEDKLSKFPSSSRLPSISGTHSPKNVNPLKIETIGTTNGSDRGSLASHVNDNEIDMDVTSEKGNMKSEGKGKLHLTSGHVGNVKQASEHDSHYSQRKNEGSTKQVKVRDASSQYHKIELDPEGDMHREPKALRLFRAALIEFIKELVKPTWREGKLSKDAHKLIVKKAVDKVVSTLPAEHIPSMQESIDTYLSTFKPKLEKLVEVCFLAILM